MTGRQPLSFEITTARQFLDKLKSEQQSLEDDLTSSRHAINAAMTAWHLVEWVWGLEVKQNDAIKNSIHVDDIRQFQDFCRNSCPELETMQCVCEGSKHLGTSGQSISSTSKKGGAFDSGFSKGFDIASLQVSKIDGSVAYFDNELKAVVDFWNGFFARYLT